MSSTSFSAWSSDWGNDQSRAWHRAHQMMKLTLDHHQIIKDIGMVELKIVQYQSPGPVMDKFGSLIKEGGIVLIRLHHKEGGLSQGAQRHRS